MVDIELVADQNHAALLKRHPGVLNTAVGKKIVDGKVTDEPAIIVYVEKKLPMAMLKDGEAMPKEIDGIKVDVVELAPTTWKAGKTPISLLPPSEQRKLVGVIPSGNAQSPKEPSRRKSQVGLEVSWKALSNKVKNQKSCGSCTAFGCIKTWEIRHKQLYGETISLSEQFLFTCSGGTCNNGNSVEATLDRALKGVCLESDLPYAQGSGQDFACREGIKSGWAARAKMLKEWYSVTDKTKMRQLIAQMPMNTTMTVHQSLFNYVSGVYHNLGASDPIAGYHDVACTGLSDTKMAWEAGNSWGEEWGEGGYFWIAFGDSGFDDEMYVLVPSNDPIPDPGPDPNPNPSPCPIAKFFAKYSPILPGNPLLAVFRRNTRWHPMRHK